MLILLILVHILSQNGSAAPVPPSLVDRAPAETCDDINNCRKLFDIVWGCLATIFACTWVSVHPNVPPPDPSVLALTHGYFFCMGGFISSTGYPVTTEKQLDNPELGPQFLEGTQKIRVKEIADKSKGDALSKGVALAQGLWFTIQCLARVHQRLTVTELEVATPAFAVVNIFIWLLWWNKPLDIQLSIIIGSPTPLDAQPIIPLRPPRLNRLLYAIIGEVSSDGGYDPLSSTSVPSFWSPILDDNFQVGTVGITALAGSMLGDIHCAAWNTDFPTTEVMWIWRSCSLVIAAVPAVLPLLFVFSDSIHDTVFGETMIGNAISMILLFGSFPIYILARLILIALPLAALRSLPPSAFVDVNWSMYIPHI
ncbi:hypothetical protein MVEN_02371200 [Mycena venus]|uniref:Uncharacterized protein n=1 Tax=Mycena venus TaxID=2733690 RepID=A0A8H6X2K4_9AGAR|nr:hypothetical protein MVEN_02371200 [Mycena venus]